MKFILLFLQACLLALPLWVSAQSEDSSPSQNALTSKNTSASENASAKKNLEAFCLGPKMAYKQYPRSVVEKIQADLYEIYHEDPEWKTTAAQSGRPLNDGLMGPITWSWMQRGCHGFALHQARDLVAELPDEFTRIAAFAKAHPKENAVLVSRGLVSWVYGQAEPLLTEFERVLYQGSEQELLDLVTRYLARNNPPEKKPDEPVVTDSSVNPYSIYVLREEDFAALKQPDQLPDAITELVDKPFASEAEAAPVIAKLVGLLPKDKQAEATSLIQQKMEKRDHYQLSEAVLGTLISSGVAEPLFSELKKLLGKIFTSEKAFVDAVTKAMNEANAIVQAESEKLAAQTVPVEALPAPESNAELAVGTPVVEKPKLAEEVKPKAVNNPAPKPAEIDRVMLFKIVSASKTTSLILTKESAAAIISQVSTEDGITLPGPVVDLLLSLQDIVYPEPELLHTAIESKLLRGLGFCKFGKANTIDVSVSRLTEEQRETLAPHLSKWFPYIKDLPSTQQACGPLDHANIHTGYNTYIRPTVEKLFREDMPAYAGLDVQWSGQQCGCVPKEMATIAYGVYPYWHIEPEVQDYDFSIFSRVAYMGLTFNSAGKLLQINADNQAQSILHHPSRHSSDFIHVARTYGSKVDWMIERDWGQTPNLSQVQLVGTLDGLRNSIIQLLNRPLQGALASLAPALSFGLIQQPMNGDGVTLYFKNYPESDAAKAAFDAFFAQLKSDMNQISDSHNTRYSQEERLYLNLVVNQKDFTSTGHVFGSANLERLTGVNNYTIQNLSQIEMQDRFKSLILVLLNDPYYDALDDIYEITPETSRSLVVPVMFTSYMNMEAGNNASAQNITDDRFKKLAYIHESFGGGGFWPITQSDASGMEGFHRYVSAQFAPGHSESIWYTLLCAYRWVIIAVMNILFLIAITLVAIAFYVFPYQCKRLPAVLALITKPIPLALIVIPPLVIWTYLLVVDAQFPFFNFSSLTALALLALVGGAIYIYVRSLQRDKPNRSFLMAKRTATQVQAGVPTRTLNPSNNKPDDDEMVVEEIND